MKRHPKNSAKRHKELGIFNQIDYEKKYLYSIITHSTAIEGSTITEVETQLLFNEGITANGKPMVEQLMPTALQVYFTENFDLNNPTAAEHKLTAFGLINIDEFDRLSAERMPLLKNLMQLERINLRRAFKHNAEPLPRIANFIATSNRYDLLTDLTGSRRFICVDVQHPSTAARPSSTTSSMPS
ncbi:Fic family protein [gut metagenome]|uniref:Fic family protein n=1 Tax=gut metagenome TaxID=749906 RepID=J9FT76_9ZZZZ